MPIRAGIMSDKIYGGFSAMEHFEIEKKYTIKRLPEGLEHYPCKQIEQAYLNTDPVVRIRKSDDSYTLTYKGSGLMVRAEYNLPLNEDAYLHLRTKADGTVISKKRYVIPLENPQFSDNFEPSDELMLNIELDIFEPPFAPLIIAEVEFPDEQTANAFVPPIWFDADVTHDPGYHNSSLSERQL